ncbi:MAG TPA: hypothetical protein VJZ76_24105 [Thermoanaerobaculia bacterium]|nr:hypothetical protein [Thermoanaerobaculia bacterium]
MLRPRFALLGLLFVSPLFADAISTEFPVSAALWQASGATAEIAVGATHTYEAIQVGNFLFGSRITAAGIPDTTTWRAFGSGHLIGVAAIGDDFFVLSDTKARDTLTFHRASDGKEVTLHIRTTDERGVFRSDGTHLWYVYNRLPAVYGVVLDANLNVTAPEFLVRPVGRVVFDRGAAARGTLLTLLVSSTAPDPNETLSYWSIDTSGKSKTIPSTPVTRAPFVSNGTDILFALSGNSTASGAWALHSSVELAPVGDITTIVTGDLQHTVDSVLAAPGGSDYYIGWREVSGTDTAIYVQRFGSTTKTRIAAGTSLTFTGMTGGPAGALAHWTDRGGNAFARRVDADDVPHPKVFLPPQQVLPSIASDGVTSMVAWNENELRAGRIARDGTLLDGAGIVVWPSPIHPVGAPQIVFDGGRYVVFWIADGSLMARRIERDGRFGGDPFVVVPNATNFAVAWDGTRYRLAWRFYDTTQFGWMDTAGNLFVGPFPVNVSDMTVGAISGGPRIVAVGADSRGVVVHFVEQNITVPIIGAPGWFFHSFHVVSNGKDYVMTWTKSLYTLAQQQMPNEMWGARFDAQGQLIGTPLLLGAVMSTAPVAAGEAVPLFDGKRYRIVYTAFQLGEALLNDDAFTCRCYEHTEVPFDATSTRTLAAAITNEGAVFAYDRTFTPPSDVSHTQVFVGFTRVPAPPRRRATK